ncbi:MAG: hypothetical protein LBO20_07800 [Bifidobacteriaceae bacterium]|nr:hypothetical protein [Bifidobacteriaceae bacterium]
MSGRPVTLYLDEDVIGQAKAEAARAGLSLSAYANRRLANSRRPWPDDVLKLLGSLKDEALEAPEELPWEADSDRPDL